MEEIAQGKTNKHHHSLTNEYFLRYGESKSGRLPFYGIEHYLVHGWQFYPNAHTNVVLRSWKILRKFKRIRAKVNIRTAEMYGKKGVMIYRRSKRFGDVSLINALAATKFMSGTVISL